MKVPDYRLTTAAMSLLFAMHSVEAATFYTSPSAFQAALVNPFTENISTSTAGRSIIAQNYNITTGAGEIWATDVYQHDVNNPGFDSNEPSLAGAPWSPSTYGPYSAYRTTSDYIPAAGAFTEFTGTEMRFIDFAHFSVNLSGGPYHGIGWNAFEFDFGASTTTRDSIFLVSAYDGASTIPVASFEWDILTNTQITAGASSFFGFTSDDAFTRLTFRELNNVPGLVVGDNPPYQPGDEGPEFFNRFTASTALAAIPEPSLSLLGAASIACGLIRRRRALA